MTAVCMYLLRRRSHRAATHDTPMAVERLDRVAIASRVCDHQKLINVKRIAGAAHASMYRNDEALRRWKYPKIVAGGACARGMAEEPFDALEAASRATPGAGEAAVMARLRALKAVCATVAEKVGAQWVGVYQIVPPSADAVRFGGDASAPNLLKLAYIGAPSRPYFPLTSEFAASSNNSTVAMTGRAVVYHDVLALPTDAPYYTCDAQVRSEACVPIYRGDSDEVIGIMDAEAFAPDVFRPPAKLGIVLAACKQLGENGMCA